MPANEVLTLVPLAVALGLAALWHQSKSSRKAMEAYLTRNRIEAVVEDSHGVPPLRLWGRNRAGDIWCKLRYADGSSQWARLRIARGGRAVDFFEGDPAERPWWETER